MAPTLVRMTGFEYGSVLGCRNGAAGTTLFDFSTPATEGTSLTVQNSVARIDGYALRCTSTAAQVANVYWTASGGAPGNSLPTTQVMVGKLWFQVENITGAGGSDRPALVHWNATTGGTSTCYFEFDEPTNNLIMTVGTGTARTSTINHTIGKWQCLDWRFTSNSTTWTMDWAIDGVVQTQATSGVVTAQNFSEILLGTNSGFNIVVSYDDLFMSATSGDYPLPDMHIQALGVNGSGTHSLTADFNQTTNNGTSLVAISSPELLVDELPPTVSTSTDAVAQVTLSASAYLEFSHADLAAGTTVYGVNHVIAGWAGGATGTCAAILRDGSTDGNTLGTAAAPVNPSWSASSTTGMWASKTYGTPPSGGTWNATLVNALLTRFGFAGSVSGTPGMNAAYIEVALPTPLGADAISGVWPYSNKPGFNWVQQSGVSATPFQLLGDRNTAPSQDLGIVAGVPTSEDYGSVALSASARSESGEAVPGAWPNTFAPGINRRHHQGPFSPFQLLGSTVPSAIASQDFGTLSGIPSAEALGTVAVTPGSVDLGTEVGIPSVQAIGASTVSSTIDCGTVAGIPSTEIVGTVAVSALATVNPVGLQTSETTGAVVLTAGSVDLGTVAGIPSTEAPGAATVAFSADVVQPGSFSGQFTQGQFLPAPGWFRAPGNRWHDPLVGGVIVAAASQDFGTLAGILSAESEGTVTVSSTIDCGTVVGVPTPSAVGAATLSATATLNPAGIPTAETVGAATVLGTVDLGTEVSVPTAERTGAVAVSSTIDCGTVAGIRSAEAEGVVVLTPGSVDLGTVAGIPSAETLGVGVSAGFTVDLPSTLPGRFIPGQTQIFPAPFIAPSNPWRTSISFVPPPVDQTVVPAGIPGYDTALGSVVVSSTVDFGTVAGVPGSEVTGTVTLTATATLNPAGIPTISVTGSATVSSTIDCGTVAGIPGSEAVGLTVTVTTTIPPVTFAGQFVPGQVLMAPAPFTAPSNPRLFNLAYVPVDQGLGFICQDFTTLVTVRTNDGAVNVHTDDSVVNVHTVDGDEYVHTDDGTGNVRTDDGSINLHSVDGDAKNCGR